MYIFKEWTIQNKFNIKYCYLIWINSGSSSASSGSSRMRSGYMSGASSRPT